MIARSSRLRLLARMVAGAGLVVAGVVVLWWGSLPDRVVLLDTRETETTRLPMVYESTQRRVVRLVLPPLCPPTGPAATWGEALADCAITRVTVPPLARDDDDPAPELLEESEGVRARLRPGLAAGPAGQPVGPAELARALSPYLSGLGVRLRAHGNTLDFASDTLDPPLLLSTLGELPAVVAAPKGSPQPWGTGPFFGEQRWCKREPKLEQEKHCTSVGGRSPIGLGSLDRHVADMMVLRRRGGSRWSGPREVVFAGLDLPVGEALPPTLPAALARALDAGRVHALFGLEADLHSALADRDSTGAWSLQERAADRVLVAALQPDEDAGPWLTEGCRPRVATALGDMAADPAFLRAIGAQPARQLLPAPLPAIHSWRQERVEQPQGCRVTLVTNTSWGSVAGEVQRRLEVRGVEVEVEALPPAEENARRNDRRYGISMLSVVHRDTRPAVFLWDQLVGSNWARKPHVDEAARLASEEAAAPEVEDLYAELDRLHGQLDSYLVPLAAPPAWYAVSRRLEGIEEGAWLIDPERLDLTQGTPGTLTWILGGILLLATWVAVLAEYRREAADRRRTTEEEGRREAERALRLLRHELLSPLSSIKAWGGRLLERGGDDARELLAEADAAMDVVDTARLAIPGAIELEQGTTRNLLAEALEPAIGAVRRRMRAREEALPPIGVELDEPVPELAVHPDRVRVVLRNLVANACLHGGSRIEVLGRATERGYQVEVLDWGPGVPESERERIFEAGFRGEAARVASPAGIGWGLSLSRDLARAAGGDLLLASPGDPTTLVVRFPAVENPDQGGGA